MLLITSGSLLIPLTVAHGERYRLTIIEPEFIVALVETIGCRFHPGGFTVSVLHEINHTNHRTMFAILASGDRYPARISGPVRLACDWLLPAR
jgi:hypothetical protein